MDCSQAIAVLIRQVVGDAAPEEALHAAQKHAARCLGCMEVLSHLHQALAEPDWNLLAEAGRLFPCSEFLPDLPVYVEANLAGQNLQQEFPLLWHHLQECPRCQEQVQFLQEMVLAEQRGELPPLPKLGHEEFPSLVIRLARSVLQQLTQSFQTSPIPVRSEQLFPPDEPVLYRDTLIQEGQETIITVKLCSREQQRVPWGLEIRVIGERPVSGLAVTCSCGTEERGSTTDDRGIATVENLPPSWLDPGCKEDILVRLGG